MTSRVQVVEGPKDKEVVVRWGADGTEYCLTHLASEGGQVRPEAPRIFLDWQTLSEHPRSLILGERRGGARNFVEWIIQQLDNAGEAWVSVRGHRWGAEHFRFCASLEKAIQKARQASGEKQPEDSATETPIDHLLSFKHRQTAVERSQSLITWARSLKKPVYLIIRDLGGMGPEDAGQAAQALRLFAEAAEQEREELNRLRLVLVSTSESRFEDRFDASGFAITCERYRLPWLEPKEVATLAANPRLAERNQGSLLDLDENTLEEVMRITGGQPELVQRALADLALIDASRTSRRAIRHFFRRFRDQPPEVIRLWKEDLEVRLAAEPELQDALRGYIQGVSRDVKALPRLEYSLMYSGWIRLDREIERWKIASEIHKYFAHEVLSERG